MRVSENLRTTCACGNALRRLFRSDAKDGPPPDFLKYCRDVAHRQV